jgi:hypothetical protein
MRALVQPDVHEPSRIPAAERGLDAEARAVWCGRVVRCRRRSAGVT